MRALLGVALGSGLFVSSASAQHEDHHKSDAVPPAQAEPAQPGAPGGMMPQMMRGQEEVAKLSDQLLTSFAAIQAEKDPAALKARLEAHGDLLKELQTKTQSQRHMSEMMQQKMGGNSENK